jgi:hypothetical protein
MLKYHAHDTVNDIALIEANGWFFTRYGLDLKQYYNFEDALRGFQHCLGHALAQFLPEDEDNEATTA